MPIPDSGTPAAVGYSRASGIPYSEGLIKNRYVGRTFIQPEQGLREQGIRLKFNPLAEIDGKRIVVVDDSIVRGTTTRQLVQMLFEAICWPVISVLGNIAPADTSRMVECYLDGDTTTATDLQLKYLPLIHALFAVANPIPVKTLVEWLGFEVGPVRLPLVPLTDGERERLIRQLLAFNLGVELGQLLIVLIIGSLSWMMVARIVRSSFLSIREREFVEAARAIKLGAAYDFGPEMGSLISVDHKDRVASHVEDARAKGATVLTGGRARPDLGPAFYEPTVLTGVTKEMLAGSCETFGPVVALHPYRTLSEAIHLANDTDYGLNASVWGSDLKRAAEVARQLQAGNVNVNEGFAAAYASKGTPSGGVKQSGVGARHGDNGLLKYTDVQNLAVVKKQVMGVPEGQPYEKYAATTLKSLAVMRKTGIR